MRKRLFGLILLSLLAGGFFCFHQLMSPLTPPTELDYLLKPGSNLSQVASDLESVGVLRSALALKLLARVQQKTGNIQSGHYRFSLPATPLEVLQRLVEGDVQKVSLTVPEGFSLEQICGRIAELGYGQQDKLLQLAQDENFISSLGLEVDSLEGYLFPETYLFTPGIDEAQLLKMMVTQFRQNLSQELVQKAQQLKLSRHQLVTLASIIEKETGKVDEMPLISSVFHNRLQRGILLQTDPTVIYAIKNFDGNLTRKHLQ